MAFDDHLRRLYLTQGRRVMDDPQTKGTLSRRERELGLYQPTNFPEEPTIKTFIFPCSFVGFVAIK
jgi:hypothetical protein